VRGLVDVYADAEEGNGEQAASGGASSRESRQGNRFLKQLGLRASDLRRCPVKATSERKSSGRRKRPHACRSRTKPMERSTAKVQSVRTSEVVSRERGRESPEAAQNGHSNKRD